MLSKMKTSIPVVVVLDQPENVSTRHMAVRGCSLGEALLSGGWEDGSFNFEQAATCTLHVPFSLLAS